MLSQRSFSKSRKTKAAGTDSSPSEDIKVDILEGATSPTETNGGGPRACMGGVPRALTETLKPFATITR
jgi:hypothetical protein